MNESTSFPDENTIHAYVDGRLDDADHAHMEDWLDRHPQRAEEIRGWRNEAQQLRAAFAGFAEAAAAPALDPAVIRARQRHRVHARLAMAAALIIVLGIGSVSGWLVRGAASPASPPMADAVEAYRMFASKAHAPLDVTQQHAGEVQAWLDTRFPEAPALPNLSEAGYRVVGSRLLATASGPAAIVLYDNAHGNAISFYIRPPSARRGVLSRGQRREGQLAIAYWSGGDYNLALVGPDNAVDLAVLRRASR